MSHRRGNENIWIAYADMLTVLLMVYLLLSLLFQVIVATSRLVGPEEETVKKQQVETPVEQIAQVGAPTSPAAVASSQVEDSGAGDGQEAIILPLVMVNVEALNPKEGEFRFDIALNRTYITELQQEQVRAWAHQNIDKIGNHKMRIYSVARSVGVSPGDVLSMQLNRAVATMAALRKEKIVNKDILFDNLIVPDNTKDYIILRIEDADNQNDQVKE